MNIKLQTTLEKVNQALSKIQEVGRVSVQGSKGDFSVKGVVGRFNFNQETQVLIIEVLDKPWLASNSMIENEIRKFFS